MDRSADQYFQVPVRQPGSSKATRLSGPERSWTCLGPANSFSPVGFLHVLHGCNMTQSFSWSCVPWPHLLLLYTWLWNASSRLWRMVLKGDLSWEWGTRLFLMGVYIGKEQSLLATRHDDNSVQLHPPTIYWVMVSISSKASKNLPNSLENARFLH